MPISIRFTGSAQEQPLTLLPTEEEKLKRDIDSFVTTGKPIAALYTARVQDNEYQTFIRFDAIAYMNYDKPKRMGGVT